MCRLGGKSHGERSIGQRRDGSQNVCILCQRNRKIATGFLYLFPACIGRAIVRHRGGANKYIHAIQMRMHGGVHVCSTLDGQNLDAGWRRNADRPTDQQYVSARLLACGGQCIAHLSGAAIRDVAYRVDGLVRGACRNQYGLAR